MNRLLCNAAVMFVLCTSILRVWQTFGAGHEYPIRPVPFTQVHVQFRPNKSGAISEWKVN